MNRQQKQEPLLHVTLQGPDVAEGRVSVDDFVRFGGAMQRALTGVALVLHDKTARNRNRPASKHIRAAGKLDIVALQAGSFCIAFDSPRPAQHPQTGLLPDTNRIAEEAAEALVGGLAKLGDDEELPPGYNADVLAAVRDAGKLVENNERTIQYRVRGARGKAPVVYNAVAQRRVIKRIRTPTRGRRSVEGRLLMADFKSGGLRCRLHQTHGKPILCEFTAAQQREIHKHLRQWVRVSGETKETADTGEVVRLKIRRIEAFDPDERDFLGREKSEATNAEQGVRITPQRFDEIVGSGAHLWDSDAEFHEFVESIYRLRRAGRGGDADE